MKINKKFKQELSLNYSVINNDEIKIKLIKERKILFDVFFKTYLSVVNKTENDFNQFLLRLNNLKKPKIKRNFYSLSFNLSDTALSSVPISIKGIEHSVCDKNNIFYYYSSSYGYINFNDFDTDINKYNFNYQSAYSVFDKIKENIEFKKQNKIVSDLENKYKLNLKVSYDNCYELIKNIRTFERLEKKFKDINKYLPENILDCCVQEESETKIEKLKKL